MKNYHTLRKLIIRLSWLSVTFASANVFASGFQLWEQDGSSIGNYHADRAVMDEASTGYYNPAGLVQIAQPELIVAADPVFTDFPFQGSVQTNLLPPLPTNVKANGGASVWVPAAHFATPIASNLVFGLSVVSPFGLQMNYGENSSVRYASTFTSLRVVDVSPSLGMALNNQLSLGLGLDVEQLKGDFDLMAGSISSHYDTQSHNHGSSIAYGYHLGALMKLTPDTRVGASYHSAITHHVHGQSSFTGPIASMANLTQPNADFRTKATLPATTTISAFQALNPIWDIMGTVSYTQWRSFNSLALHNVVGIDANIHPSTALTVVIPEHFHNTLNYSVGANYHVNSQWLLRSGIGYDQSPTNNRDRNLQLPDSDRIVLALGTHYQATKTLGYDISWAHFFAKATTINNLSQTVGAQTTVTNGSVKGSADVIGLQLKWDMV